MSGFPKHLFGGGIQIWNYNQDVIGLDAESFNDTK